VALTHVRVDCVGSVLIINDVLAVEVLIFLSGSYAQNTSV